ncbi:sensor histidine kinase [Paenibacillus allorhizosphaerae]|uniref:HAMP domain-containing protein n=1 Tax=Paenibacillus allorhizosphaerae TaxID=2849866 RepID=A0ABN7TSA3_9BACL|nr:histidine kinase [Paenibacillus allorhizosphaerae]CAG7647157.1 hypothetical protein PAECIP111802_03905 [Paenibacillus allorhizosphaerae]
MKFKNTIFSKMNAVIFFFLISILLLYGISHQVSVRVVESLLQKETGNQLDFVRKQLDSMALSLAMNAVTLTRDPTVLGIERTSLIGGERALSQIETSVQEKLTLQSSASSWYNDITLYFPSVKKTMTTAYRSAPAYDEKQLEQQVRRNSWTYRPDLSSFVYYAGGPINESGKIEDSNVIVELAFYEQNITSLLDQLKTGGKGDPFMVSKQRHIAFNRTSDKEHTRAVSEALFLEPEQDHGSFTKDIGGQTYLVNYVYSQPLGYYLVDYTQMQQILMPITTIRNWFYGCIALLLAVGLVSSFLLYKNVQVPLQALIGVLKRFQNGDFSVRLNQYFRNEFDTVVVRFNDMAGQIQYLIENVLEERNRSRLATLKQLQAQINPHFLYNCLSFVISSANLGRNDSVIAMAYNLSDYYRYITRLDDAGTRLKDEMNLVKNYLEIHLLRLQRIRYEIDIPEDMLEIRLPKLLIQPIVENAIVHGLEPKPGGGAIVISGRKSGERVQITVEDSGIGMSEERLEQLKEQLRRPMDESTGTGLWNVHQRLKYGFGETAGLSLERSGALGGLKVTMHWRGELRQ